MACIVFPVPFARPAARRRRFTRRATSLLLWLAATTVATAQVVTLNTQGGIWRHDGVAGEDSDGVRDSTLTLGAGVWYAPGGIDLAPWESLVVQGGAIVRTSGIGRLSGDNPFALNPAIRLESGAVVAASLEDAYGGDADGLGPTEAWSLGGVSLRDSDVLYLSGVTFVAMHVQVGCRSVGSSSVTVTNSTFLKSRLTVCGQSVVTYNTLEAMGCSSALEVRWAQLAVSVASNQISQRTRTPQTCTDDQSAAVLFQIESDGVSNGRFTPQSGGTLSVTSNTIRHVLGLKFVDETRQTNGSYGQDGFDRTGFRALVNSNRFDGSQPDATGTPGWTALHAPLDAGITFASNTVENMTRVLRLTEPPVSTIVRTALTDNQFLSTTGATVPTISFTRLGTPAARPFVQAENNYWGDPSGPKDASFFDGLHNPQGTGLTLPDWIDYVPYLGSGTATSRDRIVAEAVQVSPGTWKTGEAGSMRVDVTELVLRSVPGGTLILDVRDQAGDAVATSTGIPVTAGVLPPPVSLDVTPPFGARSLSVQAVILGPSGAELLRSAPSILLLELPESSINRFTISVIDPATGSMPRIERGATVNGRLRFRYDLALADPSASGRIRLLFEERDRDVDGETSVVEELGRFEYPAAQGENVPFDQVVAVPIPFRDAELWPNNEIRAEIALLDDRGSVLDRAKTYSAIENRFAIEVTRRRIVTIDPVDGRYVEMDFIADDPFLFLLDVKISVPFPAGNLELNLSVDGDPDNSRTFPLSGSQTGSLTSTATSPNPGETSLGAWLRLGNEVHHRIAVARVPPAPVRAISRDEVLAAPGGADILNFLHGGTLLKFVSAPEPGRIRVVEHPGPYPVSDRTPSAGKRASDDVQGWVSALRYWSILPNFATVPSGTEVTFVYDPAADFPSGSGFSEDSLAIAVLNPMSGELLARPTVVDRAARTATASYDPAFRTWVLASRSRSAVVLGGESVMQPPGDTPSLEAYPNPSPGSVTLRTAGWGPGPLRVEVFDLLGRRVALVHDGFGNGSDERLTWDGRDVHGAPVASGVYLGVVTSPNLRRSIPLIRIR